MIRSLTIAAAAAAVGYTVGQRAAKSPESRFSQPEVTGDDVVVEDGEIGLCDDLTKRSRVDIDNPYNDWDEFGDDEVIGQ